MEWWGVLGLVLGSNVAVKLLEILLDRLKRKDTVEDREVAEAKDYTALEKKLDEFIEAQNAVNKGINEHMTAIDESIKVVLKSSKAIQYSSLWAEAMGYVKQGSIEPEARVKFKAKIREYYETFGEKRDVFADVMAEIDELR